MSVEALLSEVYRNASGGPYFEAQENQGSMVVGDRGEYLSCIDSLPVVEIGVRRDDGFDSGARLRRLLVVCLHGLPAVEIGVQRDSGIYLGA